jgi:hypothetical protein
VRFHIQFKLPSLDLNMTIFVVEVRYNGADELE